MRKFYFRSLLKNKQALIAVCAFALFLISLGNLLRTNYFNTNAINNEINSRNADNNPDISKPKTVEVASLPKIVVVTQGVKPVEIATTIQQVSKC